MEGWVSLAGSSILESSLRVAKQSYDTLIL
jgi:hypothetical protein